MWTDRQVKGAKPRKSRYRVSKPIGTRIPGSLVLDIYPSGVKVFYYQYYRDSDRILIKIGPYKKTPSSPGWSLTAASDKAREYADQLKNGNDPKRYVEEKEKELLKAHKADKEAGTLAQLIESYLAAMEADGKRSVQSVRNSLNIYVLNPFPDLSRMKARDIQPDDISKILSRMIKNGVTVHTNRVRSYLHAAFNHGVKQQNNPRYYTEERTKFDLEYNPVSAVPRQADYEKAGEHVISEDEIRTIWSDNTMPPLIEILVKLAFATGQRAGELSRLEWKNIDFADRAFLIPETVSKNGKDHLVPMNNLTESILKEAKKITGDYPQVFTGSYKGQLKGGISLHNSTIAKGIREYCERAEIRKFIARDIRRTWKTLAGKAGISKEIRDRIQNHALSDISSIHYDRYDYLTEKREGLKVWNDYLNLIINPKEKVTRIRA